MSVKCDCLPLPFSTANQPLNGCHIYPLNQWATIRTADIFFLFFPSGTFSHPWQQWPKCFCTGHSSNSKNLSAATHRALFQTHFKYVFKENPKYQSTVLRNNSMDGYLTLRQFVLRISHQTCLMMCLGLVLICALTEKYLPWNKAAILYFRHVPYPEIRCSLLNPHKNKFQPKSLKVLQVRH